MSRSRLLCRLRDLWARVSWDAGHRGVGNGVGYRMLERREFLRASMAAAGLVVVPGALGCGKGVEGAPDSGMSDARVPGPQVVIVGAGLAGLHCAYRLKQAGVTATVYEAAARLGGRTFTIWDRFPDGQVAELGGELIDSNHLTLWALAEELGIQLDDRWGGVSEPAGDRYDIAGVSVPESTLVEQLTAVAPQMADVVAMAEADEAAFYELDNTSLADWLDVHVPVAQYAELHAVLTIAYRGEFGLETSQQSALNLLYLIDYESPDPFHIFGDSDERYHAHDGSQTFADRLAAALDPEQIVREARLVALHDQADGAYRLEFQRANGSMLEVFADHVVLAVPFTTLRRVDIGAAISAEKRDIITNLGYGTNTKVMGAFTGRVWREQYGASGSVYTDRPMQQIWDTSIGQPGEHGLITNFLGGLQGESAGGSAAEDWFTGLVVPEIERIFPGAGDAYVPGSAVMMYWPGAPLALGSYSCYLPGQWAYWGMEGVRERNIHFCGEHCSPDFQGWMEGAAETGAGVAAEILDDLGIPMPAGLGALLRVILDSAADRRGVASHPCYHGDRRPGLRWRARRSKR